MFAFAASLSIIGCTNNRKAVAGEDCEISPSPLEEAVDSMDSYDEENDEEKLAKETANADLPASHGLPSSDDNKHESPAMSEADNARKNDVISSLAKDADYNNAGETQENAYSDTEATEREMINSEGVTLPIDLFG